MVEYVVEVNILNLDIHSITEKLDRVRTKIAELIEVLEIEFIKFQIKHPTLVDAIVRAAMMTLLQAVIGALGVHPYDIGKINHYGDHINTDKLINAQDHNDVDHHDIKSVHQHMFINLNLNGQDIGSFIQTPVGKNEKNVEKIRLDNIVKDKHIINKVTDNAHDNKFKELLILIPSGLHPYFSNPLDQSLTQQSNNNAINNIDSRQKNDNGNNISINGDIDEDI